MQQGSSPATAGISLINTPIASPARPRPSPAARPEQSWPQQQHQQQPGLEVCMDCGAAFPSVSDLIQHCEAHHQVWIMLLYSNCACRSRELHQH